MNDMIFFDPLISGKVSTTVKLFVFLDNLVKERFRYPDFLIVNKPCFGVLLNYNNSPTIQSIPLILRQYSNTEAPDVEAVYLATNLFWERSVINGKETVKITTMTTPLPEVRISYNLPKE